MHEFSGNSCQPPILPAVVPGDPYRQIIGQLLGLEPEAEPPSVALDDATVKVAREAARPPWYASGLTGIVTIVAPVLLWLDGAFASQGTSLWTGAITGLYPVCGVMFIVLPWLILFLVNQSRTFYLKRAIELRKAWTLTGPIQVVGPKAFVVANRRIATVRPLHMPPNAATVQWTALFADGRLHPADSGRTDSAVAVAIFGPNGERVYPTSGAVPLLYRAPAIVASVLVSIACTAACNTQSQTYADAATRLTQIQAAAPCDSASRPQDVCSRWVGGTATWDGGIADSPVNSVCEVALRWDSGQQSGDIRVDSSACPGLAMDTAVPAQIELVKNYAIQVQVGPATYKTDLYPPYGDLVYSLTILLRVATVLWLAWPLLHVAGAVVYRLRSRSARRAGTPSPQAPALGRTS
jgi:hypothetical protein